jgi:signal transduction histidine kinase
VTQTRPRTIPLLDRSWGGVARYGTAIVVILATVALKVLFAGLGSDHPFVLLPGAVALAAWFGGKGPGLVAAMLVSLAALYFLPGTGFAAEPADLVALVALLAEGILIALLTTGLHSALVRAQVASADSAAAHREAAFALAVRDEMLALWTQQLRGPMADLEAQARAALEDFAQDGYAGEALPKIQQLVEDASRVGRATASWDHEGDAPRRG